MTPNYRDRYRVTKTGRVYDCWENVYLKNYVASTGNLTTRIILNGKPSQKRTHIIVAEVYIPNPNGYKSLFTHHPTIINLEGGSFWCSQAYKKHAEEQLKKGILVDPQKAQYKPKPKKQAPSPPVITEHSKKAYPMPKESILTMSWK